MSRDLDDHSNRQTHAWGWAIIVGIVAWSLIGMARQDGSSDLNREGPCWGPYGAEAC